MCVMDVRVGVWDVDGGCGFGGDARRTRDDGCDFSCC